MVHHNVELEVGNRFFRNFKNRLDYVGTVDEVVLVVPRPGGKILLHIKAFYPEGAYRLPTGRMHKGENPDDAFRREFREELGQEGRIDRKLGVVHTHLKNEKGTVELRSHVYLSRELTEEPHPNDQEEQIAGFEEIPAGDLALVAERLRKLPSNWRDWGNFRAIPHDFAAQALSTKESAG